MTWDLVQLFMWAGIAIVSFAMAIHSWNSIKKSHDKISDAAFKPKPITRPLLPPPPMKARIGECKHCGAESYRNGKCEYCGI